MEDVMDGARILREACGKKHGKKRQKTESLHDAIQSFREAVTTANVGTHTTGGRPVFDRATARRKECCRKVGATEVCDTEDYYGVTAEDDDQFASTLVGESVEVDPARNACGFLAESKKVTLKGGLKRKLNDDLSKLVMPGPMSSIPIVAIAGAFKKRGVVLTQEDGTEWAGFFAGPKGEAKIDLAPMSSGSGHPAVYKPFTNTYLVMTWHKFPTTGRYEVVAYVS